MSRGQKNTVEVQTAQEPIKNLDITAEVQTAQEPIKPTLIDKKMSIHTLKTVSKIENNQVTIQGRNVQVKVSQLTAKIISTFK